MFDVNTIATLSNIDIDTIRTLLPDVLNAIRSYTHKSFITNVSIADSIKISNNTIILSNDVPSDFIVDSQIELKYSINNRKIYTIKSIEGNTIETYEKLFDEEFTGFIIKLSFNISEDILANMITYKNRSISLSGIKSESTDGYSYTMQTDSMANGYPSYIMKEFDYMRQLPDSYYDEYYYLGYVK